MTLRWPKLPKGAYVRVCQECGHAQVAKDPADQKSDGWRDLKCKKCKSEAMDYGRINADVEESWE